MPAATATVENLATINFRIASQGAQGRYLQFVWSMETYARFVDSLEEGAKPIMRKMRIAFAEVRTRCNRFSDTNQDQPAIAAAVASLKATAEELRLLDPLLSWNVGLLISVCDSFTVVLREKVIARFAEAREPAQPDAKRVSLINECDELGALLMCLGDPQQGGIVERQVCIQRLSDLRKTLVADLSNPVEDPKAAVACLRAIESDVSKLMQLRSKITETAGFLAPMFPSVQGQIEKMVRVLVPSASITVRNPLSIAP